MKSLFFCLVCLAFITLSVSCKKDKDEQPTPAPAEPVVLSEELKSYGLFQPGTYWIYKNTSDNSIDSIYVTAVGLLPISGENLQIKFGMNDTLPQYYNPFKTFVLGNNDKREEILVDGLNLFRTDSTYLVNPTEIGVSENSSVGPLLVQNQNYGTCRRIKFKTLNYHAASQTHFDHTYEVFWKPHIGIVKMVQSGHSSLGSWELIRYDVKQ
jgi:hypothetical protein